MKHLFNRYSTTEKMIAISLSFTMALLAFRIIYSGTLSYIFFAWNLFLAVIPFLISRRLQHHTRFGRYTVLMLITWLLFLPNAPYVITDIFHYRERWPVPKWYDLLLVVSAAWNGLILGFISLMQVERFLCRFLARAKVKLLVVFFLFLCSYGIYIGRVLRFNTWDVLSSPMPLFSESIDHLLDPVQHYKVWEFTFLFSVMLAIGYFTLKNLKPYESSSPLPGNRIYEHGMTE